MSPGLLDNCRLYLCKENVIFRLTVFLTLWPLLLSEWWNGFAQSLSKMPLSYCQRIVASCQNAWKQGKEVQSESNKLRGVWKVRDVWEVRDVLLGLRNFWGSEFLGELVVSEGQWVSEVCKVWEVWKVREVWEFQKVWEIPLPYLRIVASCQNVWKQGKEVEPERN